MKPLHLALRDHDSIRAVIRQSGLSQDGKTPGITYPNGDAQADLIRQVYQDADLDPAHTPYIEAHGKLTPVNWIIQFADHSFKALVLQLVRDLV